MVSLKDNSTLACYQHELNRGYQSYPQQHHVLTLCVSLSFNSTFSLSTCVPTDERNRSLVVD